MIEKHIEDKYYIAVFASKNHAIHLLQHVNTIDRHRYELISTPCKIKSGCSYSIKSNTLEDCSFLAQEAKKLDKTILNIYEAEKINKYRVLKKVKIE